MFRRTYFLFTVSIYQTLLTSLRYHGGEHENIRARSNTFPSVPGEIGPVKYVQMSRKECLQGRTHWRFRVTSVCTQKESSLIVLSDK